MKVTFIASVLFSAISLLPGIQASEFSGSAGDSFSLVRTACAEENWKVEFSEICGRTDDSMGMTKEKLKELIVRCDQLKPLIEAQDETVRKVYLKRLKMCKDLYSFVLESKSRE